MEKSKRVDGSRRAVWVRSISWKWNIFDEFLFQETAKAGVDVKAHQDSAFVV